MSRIQRMLNQGAWESAQSAISSALASDPIQDELWSLQSELYEKQGQSLAAIESLEVAVELKPQGIYHNRLATLYQKLGLKDSCLEHCQAARALEPSLQNTLSLAQALLGQGLRQEALLYIKEALILEPENAQAYALLGQAMILFGRFEIAQDALQESLSLQEDLDVSLRLAALLIRQKQFSRALILLLHWQESPMQDAERGVYLKLLGHCYYWQADFPQARHHWQAALTPGFDAELFYLLSLAGPLFFFTESEQQNWLALFQDSLRLYSDWAQQMPLSGGICPPSTFPKNQRSQARVAFGYHLRSLGSEMSEMETDPEGLLGLVASDLSDPEVLASVWQWFSYAQAPEHLRLFYLSPADLPLCLAAWSAQAFQVPVQSESLTDFVRSFKLGALLFFEVEAELYYLAAHRGANLQVYACLDGVSSGLSQMDFVLAESDEHFEAKDWSEKPLYVENACLGHYDQIDSKSRTDWGLSRLGHLYLFPASPDLWTPEWDGIVEQILNLDRKAFILGLCLPDSSLHTYLTQRLGERLGERGRRRLRWLDLSKPDLPGLISVVDVVLELPGAEIAWAAYQALAQGVPVRAVNSCFPHARQAAYWLKKCGLEDSIVPVDELAQSACRIVNSPSERVMLKRHLSALAPLENRAQTSVLTIENKLYQLMKTDHHARN